MNDFKAITLESKENGLWLLKINRPESLNALNAQVLNELGVALRQIGEMDYEHAKVLVITGEGPKAFVAGADIKEIAQLSASEAEAFAHRGQSVFHELELLKIPVIAAVNGFALGGGCELALAADFIYASDNAKFGLPEVTLGLIPGFGGTVRMSRALGLKKALELTFTGDMIEAQEALQLGLVNKVVPAAELFNEVFKTAQKITMRSPLAVSGAKKAIHQNWDLSIEAAQKNEAEIFSHLFEASDVREGTTAFIEKRKAQFTGR